jgi:hypothetical protein
MYLKQAFEWKEGRVFQAGCLQRTSSHDDPNILFTWQINCFTLLALQQGIPFLLRSSLSDLKVVHSGVQLESLYEPTIERILEITGKDHENKMHKVVNNDVSCALIYDILVSVTFFSNCIAINTNLKIRNKLRIWFHSCSGS